MVEIRKIHLSDNKLYDKFIESQPNTVLFQTSKYLQVIKNVLDCEIETLVAIDENILGVLPLMSCKGKYGKVYNSLPFFGGNGGVITQDTEIFKKLEARLIQLLKNDDVGLVMLSENPFELKTNYLANYDVLEERNCQVTLIDGLKDETSLMNKFHTKTRNMVRKSLKNRIYCKIDNNAFDFLYQTHVLNMEAIGGIPKPKKFFDEVRNYFIPNKDFKIWIAVIGGEYVSGILLFYHKDTVEYYTPVINPKYRNLQPNSNLIYHAMLEAAQKGMKYWNWGGTWKTQTDLYRFKNRFGADDISYRYLIKINNKSIYEASNKELLEEYPYFYTFPFNLLHNDK
jgi:hypothetical protein